MLYPHLFAEGHIGALTLPNRILMGSMHLGYEGIPGAAERMAEFYAARARGGAALIITGGCAINEEAIGGANFSCIYRPEDLKTLQHITRHVHENGGRIGLQLFHAGRYATKEWLSGLQPVAPSPIRCTLHPTTPRAMTAQDIHRTIADFAAATLRARQVGFDCVEVMGSEGYLINQFFSPLTNQREDEWGGSLENRCRFGAEVMHAIRTACGGDYPVIFRMSGIDLMPGSNGWEETFAFARAVEQEGADALNVGIGWHESRIPTISMLVPRAYYSFAVARIKQHVKIPCICSNRINDPEVAEEMLSSGKANFVSMARALLADPEFPNKAKAERPEFVNTCIACNQACLDNAFRNEPTACILNPEAGRESEMKLRPAEFRKKVAVVGAGPSGLEASKVLAQRGHRVTLFEKQPKIGGQLLYAVQVPGKQEFFNTLRYYQSHLNEGSVSLQLECTPSPEDLSHFDAVIIATGAHPKIPDIPGTEQAIRYDQFFHDTSGIGKNVVIIGAGGIGCDIAHILSNGVNLYPPASFFDDPNQVSLYEAHLRSFPRQREIALTRRGKRIGERLGPTTRWALIQLLENRGVQMLTQIQYEAIEPETVRMRTRSGKSVLIPADTVILATGQISNNQLYQQLKDRVETCYLVGAALRASEANAQTAIWDASELARRI